MPERTNPETCLHNIITMFVTETSQVGQVCVSCESTASPDWISEYVWDYDIDYNVWIRKPNRR